MVMASVEDLSQLVPMVRIFSACANSIAHATVGDTAYPRSILHPRSNQLLPQIRDAQSGTFADTRRSPTICCAQPATLPRSANECRRDFRKSHPRCDRNPIRLGRSAAARRVVERGGADGSRQRACLLPGEALSARARSQSARAFRSRDHERDGGARLSRLDDRGIWLRRGQLRLLRADRARGRAGRQRLSLGDERAVEPRHASDPPVRHRGAAAEISAEARARASGSAASG